MKINTLADADDLPSLSLC